MSSHSRVWIAGPLAAFASGFGERLVRQGYRPGTAADQLRLMADMSGWLGGRGLEASDLTVAATEQFSAQRRASGRARLASARALAPCWITCVSWGWCRRRWLLRR